MSSHDAVFCKKPSIKVVSIPVFLSRVPTLLFRRFTMILSLALLVLFATVCDFQKNPKAFLGCHKIPPMKGFSLQKFSGKWYRISNSDPSISPGYKCTWMDNKIINATSVNVTTSTKNVWTNGEVKGSVSLQQKYKNIPGIFSIPGNAHDNNTIVDTDYRTYAVVHSCLGSDVFEYEAGTIFGRKPQVDKKTSDKAKKKLNSYGFYTDMFLAEDQLDC